MWLRLRSLSDQQQKASAWTASLLAIPASELHLSDWGTRYPNGYQTSEQRRASWPAAINSQAVKALLTCPSSYLLQNSPRAVASCYPSLHGCRRCLSCLIKMMGLAVACQLWHVSVAVTA